MSETCLQGMGKRGREQRLSGERERERLRVMRENEEPGASLSITILREFNRSRKAENDHSVWVHVYVHTGVQAYVCFIRMSVCLENGRNKHCIKSTITKAFTRGNHVKIKYASTASKEV